jgi:hypothetical protein
MSAPERVAEAAGLSEKSSAYQLVLVLCAVHSHTLLPLLSRAVAFTFTISHLSHSRRDNKYIPADLTARIAN